MDAGCTALQLRLKEVDDRDLYTAGLSVARRLSGRRALMVIDDRADVARLVAEALSEPDGPLALGLHLGQSDLPPSAAREIVGESILIGLSTHDLAQVRAASAEPVDHLGFGPIFGTASKADPDPVVGLEGLAEAIAATPLPIVAIGGLDASRAAACLEAGAAAAAMIAAITPERLSAEDPLALSQLSTRVRGLVDALA